MPDTLTAAERLDLVDELRIAAADLEADADLTRVSAVEWQSNPEQCTGTVSFPAGDAARERIVAAFRDLAAAKTEYARELRAYARRVADQEES